MAAQGMGMMGLAFCSFKKHELVWKQSAVQEQARKAIKSNSTFILPVCLVVTIMMAQTKKKKKDGSFVLLHRPGIEPGSRPWQGRILPLDQRCQGL